ncbi:hypothetical protein FQA39_LY02626 [Lamprigera yunnana]|nr:hypothetical protein FQA39_LY02626 [Lamprigera yunnana]
MLYACLHIVILIFTNIESAKILGIFHEKSFSHQQLGTTLLFELANRGHEVTMLTTVVPKETPKNLTVIEMDLKGNSTDANDFLFELNKMGLFEVMKIVSEADFKWTEAILLDTNVQRLLKSRVRFDVVLMEQLGNHALKGFCHYYNALCIMLSTMGATTLTDEQMGNPINPSYIPYRFLNYSPYMTYYERLHNSYVILMTTLHFHLFELPIHNIILHKYFPSAPHIKELFYNVSLMLVNSHYSTSFPVANVPNVIEIGGFYIGSTNELPADFREYLSNSKNGIVYFSMGSILKSKNMKKETIRSILNSFAKLKENVLWKFEGENLDLPSNVKVVKWAPQTDILAHPNVRCFVTHGGLLSTTEAIYFGVPIIGIPIFADQGLNIELAVRSGYGLSLPYDLLNEENFSNALRTILNNSTFKAVAKFNSDIFHDRPMRPLNKAVYWIEYVIKFKGASHLRSSSLGLRWDGYTDEKVIAMWDEALRQYSEVLWENCINHTENLIKNWYEREKLLDKRLVNEFSDRLIEFQKALFLILKTSKIKSEVKSNPRIPIVDGPGVDDQRLAYLELRIDQAKLTITGEEKLNMFDIQNKLALTQILFMDLLGVKICELALNSTAIQQFLSIKQHFDLIIMEEFLNQAFRGFCYHFNAHCISLSTVGLNRWSSTPMGNPRNPSYIPDLFVKFPSKMDFYQRFVNSFVDIAAILFGELYTLRKQNELLQKYFPGAPHLSDLYYNTSLMLLNSHVGVNAPVSLLPNVIPIGGYYIDPPKKLPTDLQEYLDNATRGAIYFSMGSNLRSSEMDSDKLDAILKVFSKLPYDILWKWENDTLPIQLSNVKISSWFPQGDILAHPNVKLFITHGGLLSTTETLYHGVPIVGIPIYGDQEMNIANAVQEGYALHLPYKELNEVKFAWAINEILNNTNAKILGIFHGPSHSHQQLGSKLYYELAARGHEVTIILPEGFSPKTPIKNLKTVEVTVNDFLKDDYPNPFSFLNVGFITKILFMEKFGEMLTESLLNETSVKELLKSNENFDIVVMEEFINQAYRGFCHRFNAHCIVLSTVGQSRWTNIQMGNLNPPSYVPENSLTYTSKMNFVERLMNTYAFVIATLVFNFYTLPTHNRFLQKYFPGAPHISELYYNTSLMLLNSHVSINPALPDLPNMINIGGYHVSPPKQLPKDLQEYLDNAKEGVIYFSLGSHIDPKMMPKEKLNVILKVFAKLKQKILWKYSEEVLPGKSNNIKILKWLPQSEILAHPNVVLFISHGGLLSTIETIYHGKPVVGIPILGDQEMNIANAESNGFAKAMPFTELTEETFEHVINEVLYNPKYAENAKWRSKIMHDEPMKPLDKAMFWIEYVLRHNGTRHLRTAALDLYWYQMLGLDVLAFTLIVISGVAWCLCKFLFVKKTNRKSQKQVKKKRQ